MFHESQGSSSLTVIVRNLWGVLFLVILVGYLSVNRAVSSAFRKGLESYNNHPQFVDTQTATVPPSAFDTAVRYLKKAMDNSVNREKAGHYLLRSLYLKGRHGYTDPENKKRSLTRAKKLGSTLIDSYPENLRLKASFSTVMREWVELYGLISAARDGVPGKIRKYGKAIVEKNPTLDGGVGYRILATVNHKSPYVPFVLTWPSTDRSLRYLQEAVRIDSTHPRTLSLYGRYLYQNGNEDKAKEYLKRALESSTRKDPQKYLVDVWFKLQARQKLEEIYPGEK
jgi:tetratricopeptide (TPR) repeat protein